MASSMNFSTKALSSFQRSRRTSGAPTAFNIVSRVHLCPRSCALTCSLVLEHGSPKHRQMALEHLISGLLDFATNEQGSKSVTKALKEGGKDTLNRIVKRMAEPAKGGRRAIIVDLALSVTGSQLIAAVLPGVSAFVCMSSSRSYTPRRSIRINVHSYMMLFAGTLSRSAAARPVRRSSGFLIAWYVFLA